MDKTLVSACLLGRPVRFDGTDKLLADSLLQQWMSEGRLVSVCPELSAGFLTPRPPAEIANAMTGEDVLAGTANIFEDTGQNVTEAFIRGARLATRIAIDTGCRFALLTDGSPSCGTTFVYDGSFSGVRVSGSGVVTAMLRRSGIQVFPETQIGELAKILV